MHEHDPGLEGVVPFRFACQRSGRCCRVGAGHVWLTSEELPPLAQALGMTHEAFVREHVRWVPDPRTGELRMALREGLEADRCRLLLGSNDCSVYEHRPKHCRDFPYWPSILGDRDGFERARHVCPGITVEPRPEQRSAALEALRGLYRELQVDLDRLQPACSMSGLCCRFEEAGHELFAGGLETELALEEHPQLGEPEAPGRCPYHVGGRCTARAGRPLACRTYFCDASKEQALIDLHEAYLVKLRAIEAHFGFDRVYARFPALVQAYHRRSQP